ncbi:hypothetical protein ACQEVS_02635 [Streptomyces sp. CA-181903]|uniref:hypothetical protein n=1 Tax=Streptomyces sp. CA-181903 TaxID=3240055 RepID=UPI003D921EB7
MGKAGEKATEAITATAYTADEMAKKFQEVGPVLFRLADGIREAQARHERGLLALESAAEVLRQGNVSDTDHLIRARGIIVDGLDLLVQAFSGAEKTGTAAAKVLNKLASEARAAKLGTQELTDTDRLVLADTFVTGGPQQLNEILSADELRRSSQFLDKLGGRDRQEFERLLAQSASPSERAFLMKGLAAGYDMAVLRPYAQQIHGRDAGWLRDHLTPFHTDSSATPTGSESPAQFGSAPWKQPDTEGTCVASSTITARAMADPLYALRLTTGGRPGDPARDNPDAFQRRLTEEQHRVHEEGDGGTLPGGGMGKDGKGTILTDELGPRTGAAYQYHGLPDPQARQNALRGSRRPWTTGSPYRSAYKGGTRTADARGTRY